MIDEKELLNLINKQINANNKHLNLAKNRMGEGWVEEHHEEDYVDGANTALLELAFTLDLIDNKEFYDRW